MSKIMVTHIEHCVDCPHLKTEHIYMADSFDDTNVGWHCDLMPEKGEFKVTDWRDRVKEIDIPKWCPLEEGV
jgi:hypothetical protein